MKNNWKSGCLGLILMVMVQLACDIEELSPEYFCEMKGGKWHLSTPETDAWCEMPEKPTPTIQQQIESESPPSAAQTPPFISATGEYLSPTPASAQECNATLYVQALVEVTKQTQEQSYRECEYKLSLTNIHPSEGIWVVRKTITSVHSSATNLDDSYWYSDLIFPNQAWEQLFRSSYYTNGQTSRQGVDRIAGVFNRPDCLYLLSTSEVEVISQPVEWACGP